LTDLWAFMTAHPERSFVMGATVLVMLALGLWVVLTDQEPPDAFD